MHISARMPESEAKTEQERNRVHEDGPDRGFFYLSKYIPTESKKIEGKVGQYDFTEAYLETMRQFLIEEPRVAEGRASTVSILA